MTIQYQIQNNPMTNEPCSIGIVGKAISIPMVADNTDYQAYLKWLEEGNLPRPADFVEPSTELSVNPESAE